MFVIEEGANTQKLLKYNTTVNLSGAFRLCLPIVILKNYLWMYFVISEIADLCSMFVNDIQ